MMMMVGFEQMQDTVRGKRERSGNDWLGNGGNGKEPGSIPLPDIGSGALLPYLSYLSYFS